MASDDAFTLRSLINHVTNQVVMADTDMQLNQGEAWRELTKDLPLAEGSSHLKFLGLDEIELSFHLSEKKPGFFRRVLLWFRLAKPDKTKTYNIMPAKKSAYYFKIVVRRGANKQFKTKTETNIPDISEKDPLK